MAILLALFGLGSAIVTLTLAVIYAFPFAWLLAFVVPGHLINILFFCFQFYLTGGLLNYIFSGGIKNVGMLFSIKDSPIFIYFLIMFGFSTFYLIFQVCWYWTKKGLSHNYNNDYSIPSVKYVFLFFGSIFLVPIIFTLLNFLVMSLMQFISLFFKSTTITKNDLKNFYLNGLSKLDSDFE